MTRKICLLLILSVATVALAQQQVSDGTSPTPSTQPSQLPSSGVPDPTLSTSSPATSAAPTTQPTTAASTPVPTSPSPTPAPTSPSTRPSPTQVPTTEPTNPTTSHEPPQPTTPSSTTQRPTTTLPPVAPTPPEFPKNVGTWAVTGEKSPCILLKGALQLHVNIANSSELVIDVPSSTLDNVKVYGKCNGSDTQTLNVNWWSTTSTPDASKRNNTLTLKFAKQPDEQYGLMSVKYNYAHDKHTEIDGPFFLTNLNHSYLCKSNQRVQNENGNSYMLTQDLQFEAFRNGDEEIKGEPQFSSADNCKADNRMSTGVVLGIAVGIGLLVVVVISLGIYLFKRCRRDGYQPLETYS